MLAPEYQEFRQTCSRFVKERVMPLVDEAEETETFPAQLWKEFGANGFLGLTYPERVGGSEAGLLAMAIFAEEMAKASGGIAVTPLVSAYMAAPHLLHFGTEAQQEEYLRPVINGEKVAAIAVTEPGAGSDVAGISLKATKDGDSYRLNGTKMFITNGGFADFIIVAGKTNSAERHRGITMFIVHKDDRGFAVGRPLKKMGWHSSDTRELIFEDCVVPASRILGEEGRGFYQIMTSFQTERIALAAMGVGHGQVCLDDAVEYAKVREAFGAPITQYQAVRHALSEMRLELEAARLVTYEAAMVSDAMNRGEATEKESAEAVAMCKLFAARAANNIADRAVQVFGGYGFLEETKVAMHYRDARILRIGGGTDETQLEILAKRMGVGG